ncbi:MAG: hypothetical protein AAF513_00330 [Pseudomonadota bacterium]
MHQPYLSRLPDPGSSNFNPALWWEPISTQPAWRWSIYAYAGLLVVCLLAMGLDERTLHGVSVWSKPFKFSLSLVVYFATLAWAASLLPGGVREGKPFLAIVTISSAMALFEMIYITYQAGQGAASHFNFTTPLHATMYSLMGIGATLMVLVLLALAALIGRYNRLGHPLVLATVIGLVLTFVLGGGFGGYLGSQGGHWVGGTQSDATGTALFNWSRSGGDLRVAHFFGMHAMQAIPLFALSLQWLLPKRASENAHITAIITFAVAYAAFSTMTFVQAVQGKPFLS